MDEGVTGRGAGGGQRELPTRRRRLSGTHETIPLLPARDNHGPKHHTTARGGGGGSGSNDRVATYGNAYLLAKNN